MNDQHGDTWQTVGAALIVGAMAGAAWFAVHTPRERPGGGRGSAGRARA